MRLVVIYRLPDGVWKFSRFFSGGIRPNRGWYEKRNWSPIGEMGHLCVTVESAREDYGVKVPPC